MTAAQTWLWRLIGRLAFNRIAIIDEHKLPPRGPVLFVATHRNGALDAAPYIATAPDAVPMVSAQLHRLPLGRFIFRGIAVARAKDKVRGIEADNEDAMRKSVELLKTGGKLLIMPEGTSSLGPRHLPFRRGAARIAKAAMEAGVDLTIVPLGVHYEAPTQWQSRVEVLVGDPIRPASAELFELHDLICNALEKVGANFTDAADQAQAEQLAYAATLGSRQSYARALKGFERNPSSEVTSALRDLEQLAREKHLRRHQGIPLMPIGTATTYIAYWLLLLPLVSIFALANLPVLAAGYTASRTLPDDDNVIAFWRILIALPVAIVWIILVNTALLVLSKPIALAIYWIGSVAGIGAWYRFRKLTVAVYNRLLHADARATVLSLHQHLLEYLHHDRVA